MPAPHSPEVVGRRWTGFLLRRSPPQHPPEVAPPLIVPRLRERNILRKTKLTRTPSATTEQTAPTTETPGTAPMTSHRKKNTRTKRWLSAAAAGGTLAAGAF